MADGNLFCLGGVGVIFILIALSVAISAIKEWRRYHESDNWTPVTAEIISANISSRKGTKSTTYFVNITYAYEVFGQPYQSGQFSFGSEGTGYETKKAAEKVIAKYPPGSKQMIYYDPNQPAQAVLERKYDATSAILAVIVGLAGFGMVIYSYVQLSAMGK
jgi:hypothetical protein